MADDVRVEDSQGMGCEPGEEAAKTEKQKGMGTTVGWLILMGIALALAGVFMLFRNRIVDFTSSQMAAFSSDFSSQKATGGWNANAMAYDGVEASVEDVAPNTEEYAEVEETGFVSTTSHPLSTVSADVDTASYANLRRMLRAGYRVAGKTQSSNDSANYDYLDDDLTIPAGAVRIEEMLNYFDYAYLAPKGDDRFSVTARVGDCPWNPNTKLVTLGFATAPDDGSAARVGRNLVFLVDVSGSMDSPDKLALLKQSFAVLTSDLNQNDRISIVTYADGERVVLDGASGAARNAIIAAMNGLTAGGSTNGEAGLEMAYDLASKHFVAGGVNRIVMASDGDLNVGISSVDELHAYVDAKRETGIYLSVLGFGTGNYKDTNMEALADHGNGSYHYIDCVEEAERVLGAKLSSNTVPFADDVKVQVEFNPSTVKSYRLVGYENRRMADEDFRDDTKDAGDVGPGSQFTVAYEVVLADSALEVAGGEPYEGVPANGFGAGDDAWLRASLRYRAFVDNVVHEQSTSVGAADEGETGDDWRFQAALIEFGMLLRGSDYVGTATYDTALALAQGAVGTDADGARAELCQLIGLAKR